jgi:hypothetical protein
MMNLVILDVDIDFLAIKIIVVLIVDSYRNLRDFTLIWSFNPKGTHDQLYSVVAKKDIR